MKRHFTKSLSSLAGRAAYWRLPGPLASLSVRTYARCYGVDCQSAAKPLREYRSIGELFSRELRPGQRPIGNGIVSPVDGVLKRSGLLAGGVIEQVKGKDYQLSELLGDPDAAGRFQGGTYLHFYLSPRDYHHVHAPHEGDAIAYTRIPGVLFPVNDWCVKRVPRLFVRNERAVCYFTSSLGRTALVMVGALNVGGIELTCDSENGGAKSFLSRELPEPLHFCAGDRVGSFRLGSSVILLFERGRAAPLADVEGKAVHYGEMVAEKVTA